MNHSAEQERRVLELVEAALELPSQDQESYVSAQPVALEIKQRATKLLRSASTGGDWLTQAAQVAGTGRPHPKTVGPYRVVSLIGEGGMCRVYLGQRSDGVYEGEVAIKVLHPHIDGAQFSARFESERQILASLKHPNISQLLDGGALADGTPYFVMERIDGIRIDRYVEQEGLSVPATLRLFGQLCEAVQAAHQSLVVHRDIKPSNVLVTKSGQAKLLDFGIAKSLTPSDTELTRTSAIKPMTLDYASPEQLQHKNVGTSTDVYSLGVLLYRLLSGHKPFNVSSQSYADFEKSVLEHSAPPLAAHATPQRRSELDADLDLIVQTALAKEPERRYVSAAALGQEIEDYLRGAPIRARGDSTWYQLKKFCLRHRLGIAAGGAMATAFVIAFGVSVSQTQIAKDAAQRSATTSALLTKILLAPSSRADSPFGLGSDAKISTLLAAAEQEIANSSSSLDQTPDIKADLLVTIARSYHGLAMYSKADTLLSRANELCGANRCDANQLAARLAYHTGQAKVMLGQPELALQHLSEAQALLVKRKAPPPLLANVLNEKASALWSVGQREATVQTMEQAVSVYEVAADDPSLVAVAYTRLGSLYSNLGRLTEGLIKLKQAAAIHEAQTLRALPEVADLYNEISTIHWKRGEKPESYQWLLKAHDVVTQIDGTSEIEIRILTNLGLEVISKDLDQARHWLAESQAAVAEFATDVHEARAWVDMLEGRILTQEQQHTQAIVAFEKAQNIYQALMPAYNDSHAGVDISIGAAYQRLQQFNKALPYNRRVFDYYAEIYAEEDTAYLRDARVRLHASEAALGLPLTD